MKESPNRSKLLCFHLGDNVKNYLFAEHELDKTSKVVKPIGEGGSGVVFLVDQVLHQSVSIKRAMKFFIYSDDNAELSAHKPTGPISTKDFLSEIVNISSVSHENVIKVIDAGFYEKDNVSIPFIVTEYIQGPTLRNAIKDEHNSVNKQIKDSPSNILDILLKIGHGLLHLHNKGFAHCDIAPKNIFLNETENYKPVIGDLGIAKNIKTVRESVFIAGSKDYMPPEAILHLNKVVDWNVFKNLHPRWDVYAFARTGIELLSVIDSLEGNFPWKAPLLTALNESTKGTRYSQLDELVERIEFLHPVNREVANVPELSLRVAGSPRKLMPVEPLSTTKRVRKLIQHPAIIRLAKVNQITTAYQVFPGATHTRYEHSLGVMETIKRYIHALLDQEEFLEHLSSKKIETALLCGLLWNITRFPFSNIIHEIKNTNREILSRFSRESLLEKIFILKDYKERTLPDFIEEKFPSVSMDNLLNILKGEKDQFDNEDRMIFSLLNSSLDARVLDFVRRDSLHLGITIGDTFNLDDLLPHLCIKDHKLALRMTGVSIAEQIISLRYWLYNRIYWCRPNRIFVSMVRYLLVELLKNKNFVKQFEEKILTYTDRGLLRFLNREAIKSNNVKYISVSELLVKEQQELYWLIYDVSIWEESQLKPVWDAIEHLSQKEIREIESDIENILSNYIEDKETLKRVKGVLIDLPNEPGMNKLGEDIVVIHPKMDKSRGLPEVSGIVKGVNESFEYHLRRLRVSVHPILSPREKEKQDNIRRDIYEYFIAKWT